MTVVQALLVALHVLAVAGLVIYGVNAYVMVATHWRHRREVERRHGLPDPLPAITVQLPIYNERYVATRLLEAVAALDYPRDRLEIQALDDSTDDTTGIVAALADRLRADGLEVVHLHRRVRTGFKAGALADGLRVARGEFVAIFDADFVPSPRFLREALPYFQPGVAVVQARWGHLNRAFSALTVAQSLGIDGHFAVEQSARARAGLFLNFNGTGGIWRRAAILDAGGWTHDTVTEDLDLSYRAQLRGWRIVYRPDIVCPAELPVLVTGFKSQQRRWAKGSIQTAIKLLPAVLVAPRSPWVKYQAFVHLTYYMIHPLMLASVLLTVPMLAVSGPGADGATPSTLGLVLGLVALGPGTMLAYAQGVLDRRWWRRLWQLPTILVIGVGVALSTSIAVVEAFVSRRREFIRTPKFGIAGPAGTWRGKGYGERASWGGAAEVALGVYCAAGTHLYWVTQRYTMVPFLALYTLGFFVVGGYTIAQSLAIRPRAAPFVRRVSRAGSTVGLVLGALVAAPAAGAGDWDALVADGGALVDAGGRFRIELADGGQYGVHVYASGYIYAPQAVRVESGKTLELTVTLVPEPTRAHDPVVKQAGFFPWEARQGKVSFVKLDVGDPDDDLGPQVMAFNAATGQAYAMQPPRRVRDLKANFPQGVYQIEIDTSQAPANPRDWHFVVADHQCNTTDVLSFPHEPRAPQIVR